MEMVFYDKMPFKMQFMSLKSAEHFEWFLSFKVQFLSFLMTKYQFLMTKILAKEKCFENVDKCEFGHKPNGLLVITFYY